MEHIPTCNVYLKFSMMQFHIPWCNSSTCNTHHAIRVHDCITHHAAVRVHHITHHAIRISQCAIKVPFPRHANQTFFIMQHQTHSISHRAISVHYFFNLPVKSQSISPDAMKSNHVIFPIMQSTIHSEHTKCIPNIHHLIKFEWITFPVVQFKHVHFPSCNSCTIHSHHAN